MSATEFRTTARDTVQLKGKIDDQLLTFAERLQSSDGTMQSTEALVDECGAEMITCIAHYIRKILRRNGIDPSAIDNTPNTD